MSTATSTTQNQNRNRRALSHRAAVVVSEVLAPWTCAALMPPLIATMTSTPWWHGLLIGLMVTTLTALIPHALLTVRVRRGRYSDRHLSHCEDRPRFLALVVALALLSLLLAHVFGGSRAAQVFIALMLVSAAVGAVISRWWKISVHALVLAASLAVLIVLAPVLVPLSILLPVVIWARLRLGAHTTAQLIFGGLLGASMGAVAATIAA